MRKLEGKWLAAVSGGPDSMALLQMCLDTGIDVAAAHVNYHHRKQAEEEEAYVRTFCSAHQIECYVRNEPFASHDNFEADARDWRYDFFEETVRKYGYRGVLIAHQEDDLIETYMMQNEKNIVPAWYGLKEENMYEGMLVVRPLLSYTKKQLQDWCEEHHVKYYIDVTNMDETYARNKVRHENVEKMSRNERDMVLNEIHRLNAEKQERMCRVRTMIDHGYVSIAQYRSLSALDREALMRMTAEPEDNTDEKMSLAHIREIDHIVMSRDDFEIDIHEKKLVQENGFFFLCEPYHTYRDVYQNAEEMENVQKTCYSIGKGHPGIHAVTLTENDFPVTVRNFEPGDSIQMRFGTKAVHRFFIDRHIPLYKRRTWPVMTDKNDTVILIAGLGCDVRHYAVNPQFDVLEYNTSRR
jgi:tRNA(Ile)-lysidine synthase